MRFGLTLTEQLLLEAQPDTGYRASDRWEMGRLVMDPEFRGGVDSLRRCLCLAVTFLQETAQAGSLHASCTPALARLYRRFGFEVAAEDVPLQGSDKRYTLISGPMERVTTALSDPQSQPRAFVPISPATSVGTTVQGAFA
jgi:hypothetical protein